MFRFVSRNFIAKIIVILLAVGLWFFVANEGYKIEKLPEKLPLKILGLEKNLALASDLPEIEVEVRASITSWKNITAVDFKAYIDLTDLEEGEHQVNVNVVSSHSLVQVADWRPKTILIELSPLSEKIVPVVVQVSGSAGEGFNAGEIESEVKEVKVVGAESKLKFVSSALVKIELHGEMASIKQKFPLQAYDEKGKEIQGLSFLPSEIEVSLPIEKSTNSKTLGIKANLSGNPAPGFWVQEVLVDPATVTVQGAKEQISPLEFLNTERIDIQGVKSDVEKIVTLSVPKDLTVSGSKQVNVKVKISSFEVTRVIAANIVFSNLGDNLKVESISPATVQVGVRGAAQTVNALSSGSIKIEVDLKGKKEGAHQISISRNSVKTPEGVSVESLAVDKIKITLSEI